MLTKYALQTKLKKLQCLFVEDEREIVIRTEQEDWRIELNKIKAEIPELFLNSSFANYNPFKADEREIEKLKQYAARLKARVLYNIKQWETCIILGGNGSGKTHLGISLLHAVNYKGLFIESNILCMRIARSRAFKALKDEESVINEISSYPFLVIDEVGRARDTETERHALFDIINKRYQKRLNTCLISNKSKKEIQDFLGKSVIDRIGGAYFFAELQAPSYRLKSAMERHTEAILF